MAENQDSSQEKTEEPTQRKLDKAREDGKVISSKEMFVFTTMAMALLMLSLMGGVADFGLNQWRVMFQFDSKSIEGGAGLIGLTQVNEFVIVITLIVGVPLIVVVLLTQLMVGGINFAPKSFSFKGNRLNPIAGLGRIFSTKGLVELGKSILKVVLLFSIAAYVIYRLLPELIWISSGTLRESLRMFNYSFPLLLAALLVALLLIAAIDYAWQFYSHQKSLKMSRQELKDESKQTDGSPEVKAKIRRMQMEQAQATARERTSIDQVSEATAVITNPTHFAVAVRYVPGEMTAPTVVAAGRGAIARDIIAKAESHQITVFQSKMLARALYFTARIGAEIPEKLYNALAVALAYIYRVDRGEMLEAPEIELPEDMLFNEQGQQWKPEDG